MSLAIAMMATALIGRSVQVLRLAKADLERSRQIYALDGVHLAAVAAVIRSGRSGPFAWTISTEFGWMEATAEPEAEKLGLGAAAGLGDAVFEALGVAQPARLRARLAEAAAAEDAVVDIASLDGAPLWRACAPSVVSSLGRGDALAYAPRGEPTAGPEPASWRVGEAWRVSIATSAGWRDDRLVRFTGDARHPSAVVVRRLTRNSDRGGECDTILTSLSGR